MTVSACLLFGLFLSFFFRHLHTSSTYMRISVLRLHRSNVCAADPEGDGSLCWAECCCRSQETANAVEQAAVAVAARPDHRGGDDDDNDGSGGDSLAVKRGGDSHKSSTEQRGAEQCGGDECNCDWLAQLGEHTCEDDPNGDGTRCWLQCCCRATGMVPTSSPKPRSGDDEKNKPPPPPPSETQ